MSHRRTFGLTNSTFDQTPTQTPPANESSDANTPRVQSLNTKLAYFPRNRLCLMRKDLRSQLPNTPDCRWCADIENFFI